MSYQPPGDGSDNPYAPPGPGITLGSGPEEADRGKPDRASAEVERRANLAAEATARSIGVYYCIGSASTLLEAGIAARDGTTFAVISKLIQFSIVLTIGYYLLYLKNWARWAAIVMSCLDALAWAWIISKGLLFSLPPLQFASMFFTFCCMVYVVVTLFSGCSRRVFSARYRAIVKLTPQLRARFGTFDLFFLRLFVLAQIANWVAASV